MANPVGRPTKYNPDRVKRILDAIRSGAAYVDAANYAGISYQTFNEWRKEYPEFSDAVEEADGAAMVGLVATIRKAATEGKQWQAAAWLAERRHPDRYGRTVKTEVSGPEGGPVAVAAQIVVVPADAPSIEAWAATAPKPNGDA